jgi:enterochelin esterase-like enzyme
MICIQRLAQYAPRLKVSIAFLLLATIGCVQGKKIDFLGPDTTHTVSSIASIRLDPRFAIVKSGEQVAFSVMGISKQGATFPVAVSWRATNGTITPDGHYTAADAGQVEVFAVLVGNPQIGDSAHLAVWQAPSDVVSESVTPALVIMRTEDTVRFTALSELGNGAFSQHEPVIWSASGGTIDTAGTFTAVLPGTYTVTATAYNGVRGSTTVSVRTREPVLTRIGITPKSITLAEGQAAVFEALGVYEDGATAPVPVTWTGTGGTMTGAGLFIAGITPGSYSVVATYPTPDLADTATVTVSPPVPVRVSISPGQVSMAPGAVLQFAALIKMSDSTFRTGPANWTADGGAVNSQGTYTAGATPGTYHVVVNVSGAVDTALVTVINPQATLVSVLLNPSSVVLPAGAARQFFVTGVWSDGGTASPPVTWSATGGSITAAGLYVAGTAPGDYQVIATAAGGKADTSDVTVSPPDLLTLNLLPGVVDLMPGQTIQFSAGALWSDGATSLPPLTWTATGGAITASGLYTAGSIAGTWRVIVAQTGGTVADTSLVSVSVTPPPPPTLSSLDLSPATVTLATGGVEQFAVFALWSNGSTATPPVTWSATGGAITSTGRYTAGAVPGLYRVIATHTGGTRADTSAIQISAPVTLTSLTVAPGTVSLLPSANQQFSLTAAWSNGSTAVPPVTWTATGGTVSSGGLYSAGSVIGTWRVIATQQGGTKADTAVVSILGSPPPPPTLSSLVLSPSSASVATGGTRQFTLSATWSDGSTTVPPIAWTATGGTVSGGGLYTAGSVAGTWRVIATQQGGTKADTAAVTVTSAPPPTLSSLVLSPSSTSVAVAGTRQFTLNATWSDGSTTVPAVNWTATGGTVSTGGLYTAGSATGNFRVIVTQQGGTKADTSAVTVTSAVTPPTGPATIVTIAAFHSNITQINVNRPIKVYLPPGYSTDISRRYPVLYIQGDGDFGGGMDYSTVATGLIQGGVVEPIIMVGINTDASFSEWLTTTGAQNQTTLNYQSMVTTELVPYIDATYRTRANAADRGSAGVSAGGQTAWRLGLHYSSVFGKVAAFSPPLGANNDEEVTYISGLAAKKPVKIYWSRGGAESPIQHAADALMVPALVGRGWVSGVSFLYENLPAGGTHTTTSFKTRVDPMLRFLFPGP